MSQPISTDRGPIHPDRHGLYHPADEGEVVALVLHARARGLPVRVVGSGRSEPASIHNDPTVAGRPSGMEMALDHLRRITFDDACGEVTVEAGCKISHDPHDPTGPAPVEDGLLWHLDQRGLALPVLTGGSCQTVGGYLAGGSDGGSLHHAIGDVIVGVRLVDGRGRIHELRRERDDALFCAAGVSLGLLGIVTAVTLRPVPRFDIIGEEWGKRVDDAGLGLTPGHEGELVAFLRAHPYARVMWWPQPAIQRAVAWTARPMRPDEYVGDAVDADGRLVRAPYQEVPKVFGSPLPAQAAGSAVLTFLGRAPRWYRRVAGTSRPARTLEHALRRIGRRTLKPMMLAPFVTNEHQAPQRFRDTWWQGLPMDAQIDERLMPVRFTELWFPVSRAEDAVRALRERFERGGDDASGRFITEMYGGGRSPFWLSPAWGEDQLRVNVFWHKYDDGDPTTSHFRHIWEDLERLAPRYHWGKALPAAPEGADGSDNDCDGAVDEDTLLADDDGDGWSEVEDDCDDADATIHPGAIDACDGVDNNCDLFRDDQPVCGTLEIVANFLAFDATAVNEGATVTVQAHLVHADAGSLVLTWSADPDIDLSTSFEDGVARATFMAPRFEGARGEHDSRWVTLSAMDNFGGSSASGSVEVADSGESLGAPVCED